MGVRQHHAGARDVAERPADRRRIRLAGQGLAQASSEGVQVVVHEREERLTGFRGQGGQLLRVAEPRAFERQRAGLVEDDLADAQGPLPDTMVAQVDAGTA